jgi:hypothetical protein
MTEQLLTGAGFQKKVADTPEKLAHLDTLTPARRLVAHQGDDKLYYVYADPAMCECLYVGTRRNNNACSRSALRTSSSWRSRSS